MSNPIERQYITPNCTLLLEGFSDSNDEQNSFIMSVLTQAQCQIIGSPHKLKGGITFFEHLTKAISAYTQGLLSGLNHPWEINETSDYIEIKKSEDKNRHLLIWQSEKDNHEDKLEIELSTIQLFDLQDAIDQFYNDEYTLPQIQDELKPLSRRHRQAEVSLVEQSTPAALGFVSFSLAAILMFIIPNPTKIDDPNLKPKPTNNNTQQVIPDSEK
jgi:Domain of unknown function (DUF4335)